MKTLLNISVNSRTYEVAVDPQRLLVDFLREDLGLTGTKHGCGHGDCGACVVLLDGVPVNSCLILALQAEGREVTTIEGVADGSQLSRLQRAFVEHGAVQCGYCTPGMILVGQTLLRQNPSPSETEVRQAISGNLCRCTGYDNIVKAIMSAGDADAAQGTGGGGS